MEHRGSRIEVLGPDKAGAPQEAPEGTSAPLGNDQSLAHGWCSRQMQLSHAQVAAAGKRSAHTCPTEPSAHQEEGRKDQRRPHTCPTEPSAHQEDGRKDQRRPGLWRQRLRHLHGCIPLPGCASPLLASLLNQGGQQACQVRPDVPAGPGLVQLLHRGPTAWPGERSAQPPAASSFRVSSSLHATFRVSERAQRSSHSA